MKLKEWLEENELTIAVIAINNVKLGDDVKKRRVVLNLVGTKDNVTCLRSKDNWVIHHTLTNEKDRTMPLVGYALLNLMGEIMGEEIFMEEVVYPDNGPGIRNRLGTLVVPKSFECGAVVEEIISLLESNCA